VLVKRTVDFVVAAVGLAVLSPLLVLVSIAALASQGRPLFFTQQRLGLRGEPIQIRKFRTMQRDTPHPAQIGQVTPENAFLTPLGKFLRRSKIDELPQLWNVVVGHMSIVGPRPALLEDLGGYCDLQKQRLVVKPGITGWAQVNGNIHLTWDTRITLDVWYVAHQSLRLDVLILMRTVQVVIAGERPTFQSVQEATAYAESLDGCSREHCYGPTGVA
jgi:sugar transferase EpsL